MESTNLQACTTRPDMELALTELAERGELNITELLKLSPKQKELAGQVLLGIADVAVTTELGSHRNPVATGRIPPSIANYPVRIEAVGAARDPDNPMRGRLRWVVGTRPSREQVGHRSAAHGLSGRNAEVLLQDDCREVRTNDQFFAEVMAPDAYLLLKQHGHGLSYVSNPEHERQRWICREVRPAAPTTAKGKR